MSQPTIRTLRIERIAALVAIMAVAMAVFFYGYQASAANGKLLAADLSSSTKEVNRDAAQPGDTVRYSITIDNSGDMPANGVVMTDGIDLDELTFVPGSLDIDTSNGAITLDAGEGMIGGFHVITWTGVVDANGSAIISFDAVIDETLDIGTVVTNQAIIAFDGTDTMVSADTELVEDNSIYLPYIARSVPTVSAYLSEIPRMNGDNGRWRLDWIPSFNDPDVTGYEIEIANNPEFDNASSVTTSDTFYVFNEAPSTDNVYYYRVRAVSSSAEGPWSDTIRVVGPYADNFNNTNGGWKLVREDTDDTDNSVYYQTYEGNTSLGIKIGGRWDYTIASSLAEAPVDNGYALETRVKLDDPDNLNAWGFIYGADWDGSNCPNNDFSSCFNHYYRLQVIWKGCGSIATIQLKRIDFHDEGNNAGRGDDIISGVEKSINGDMCDYNTWRLEVEPNGIMRVIANGSEIAQGQDSRYIDDIHFGLFASSDEYLGSEPYYDYIRVLPLD